MFKTLNSTTLVTVKLLSHCFSNQKISWYWLDIEPFSANATLTVINNSWNSKKWK